MGKIQIKLIVTATDTRKYAKVEFGTYEAEFDIEQFLKAHPRPIIWDMRINNEAGITKDNRLAFFDSIQVRPRVVFSRPPEEILTTVSDLVSDNSNVDDGVSNPTKKENRLSR